MIKAVSFQIPALAVSYMSQIAASLPLGQIGHTLFNHLSWPLDGSFFHYTSVPRRVAPTVNEAPGRLVECFKKLAG